MAKKGKGMSLGWARLRNAGWSGVEVAWGCVVVHCKGSRAIAWSGVMMLAAVGVRIRRRRQRALGPAPHGLGH